MNKSKKNIFWKLRFYNIFCLWVLKGGSVARNECCLGGPGMKNFCTTAGVNHVICLLRYFPVVSLFVAFSVFVTGLVFHFVCLHRSKVGSCQWRMCTAAPYPLTLSEVITVSTQACSFPLILRHNLCNWCQSGAPCGESPENTHRGRHAHLLMLKKQMREGVAAVVVKRLGLHSAGVFVCTTGSADPGRPCLTSDAR